MAISLWRHFFGPPYMYIIHKWVTVCFIDCTYQAAYSGYRSRTSTRRAELNRRVPSTARCLLARNSARKNWAALLSTSTSTIDHVGFITTGPGWNTCTTRPTWRSIGSSEVFVRTCKQPWRRATGTTGSLLQFDSRNKPSAGMKTVYTQSISSSVNPQKRNQNLN